MYKGSNKTYVFDINAIQNKLKVSEIKTPSTKAFQHQVELRQKNYQSDIIKQSLQQPTAAANSTTLALHNKLQQIKQQNSASEKPHMPTIQLKSDNTYIEVNRNNPYQSNQNQNLMPSSSSQYQSNKLNNRFGESGVKDQGNKFSISQRSNMYDFRKQTLSSSYSYINPQKTPSSQSMTKPQQTKNVEQQKLLLRPLTPIKENEQAQVIQNQIVPPSRSVMDPDNSILFLDNGSRIVNPTNVKTPPPPMWGEILEEENYDPSEEFYDHQKALQEQKRRQQMQDKKDRMSSRNNKKLKKKVIYVYESDSDNEEKEAAKYMNNNLTKSLIQLQPPSERISRDNYYSQSKRGISTDAISTRYQINPNGNSYDKINSRQQQSHHYGLPSIIKNNGIDANRYYSNNNSKPPLPISSSGNQFKSLSQNTTSSTRQIRTGGFQKLPTIALLQKQ